MRLKTAEEIELMALAGNAAARALEAMKAAAQPGVSTLDLDTIARDTLAAHGAKPALIGYKPPFSDVSYRHTTCISINEEIIHGVPSASRRLREGDVVGLDLVASYEGWLADTTITIPIGSVSRGAQRLVSVTHEALLHGIAQVKPGSTTGDIGAAIQRLAEKNRLGIVRELTGHAIGQTTHEDYEIYNFGKPGKGLKLVPGMTFCIEPMLSLGSPKIAMRSGDPWTIVMADGSLGAHFEHTVAVTETGCRVLTVRS